MHLPTGILVYDYSMSILIKSLFFIPAFCRVIDKDLFTSELLRVLKIRIDILAKDLTVL